MVKLISMFVLGKNIQLYGNYDFGVLLLTAIANRQSDRIYISNDVADIYIGYS